LVAVLVKAAVGQAPMHLERLWAPWRLSYLVSQTDHAASALEGPAAKPMDLPTGADPDCFLCRAVADSADRDNLVVQRGQHAFTLLNRYPYNNGHLLVALRAHASRLEQLSADEQLETLQTIARMTCALERLMHPDGFNIGLNLGRAAGAGVPGHLHWHILPRWHGDTNFMPTLAATRVIPQALDSLWVLLTEALEQSAEGTQA
jgi:ATP adenylyltransferase